MVHRSPTEQFCYIVLFAMRALKTPLARFGMCGLRWSQILGRKTNWAKHKDLYPEIFGSLDTLDLDVRLARVERSFFGWPQIIPLQALLQCATTTKRLDLDLGTTEDNRVFGDKFRDPATRKPVGSMFQTPVGTASLKHQIPVRLIWSHQLEKLYLSGITCTTKELKTVLSHCAATLKDLALENLLLLPKGIVEDRRRRPRACLGNLFNVIQPLLVNLNTVSVEGHFHNGGMQRWYIWPDFDTVEHSRTISDIKTKLHLFLLNQGESPLQPFCIPDGHYDLLRPQHESSIDADLLRSPNIAGDSRFEVYYDHEEKRTFETNEEEDSDDEYYDWGNPPQLSTSEF